MQDNYQQKVYNPQMQRIMDEKEREARDYNEVKSRFDKEKEFIDG